MGELLQDDGFGNHYFAFRSQVGDIVAHTGNSTLFLHDYENAGADHLFIQTGETEDNFTGVFLWRVICNDMENNPNFFNELVVEMQEAEWDTLITDTPSEGDQANFDRYVDKQIPKIKSKHIRKWLEGEDGTDS